MVGSSGGILFLAEFIVTSVSLLLGGAGTMSVDTMQSWFIFIFFSSFAALGYAIGRAGIVEGFRNKKRCLSSILLCVSIILAPCSWWIVAIYTPCEFPVRLIVNRASESAIAHTEEIGGEVTTAHMNRLAMKALISPEKFPKLAMAEEGFQRDPW